jgi:hypothetical protein
MPAPQQPQEATVAQAHARQLTYLKNLADRTGQTFTYPHTAAEATRAINRLKLSKAWSRTERHVERKQIADQIAAGPLDAARVREDEISGHGSSATWAQSRERERPATEKRPAARRSTPAVGKRTELARYQLADGERVLYGQRIDGVVRVTDRPAGPGGRSSLVERDLQSNDQLEALVTEYVAQARQHGRPPMSRQSPDGELEAAA